MVWKKLKRISPTNSKAKMCDNDLKEEEDRISELSDEVLSRILSLLTIREATRTCVLSHRWEKLWNLYNGSLIFDFTVSQYTGLGRHREHERHKFIDWVNQVLTSIDGNYFNEFIVRSYSDQVSKPHIDRWVAFAFKSRVQKLELDMRPLYCDATKDKVRYTFPDEILAQIKEPTGLYAISSLTSLSFKDVDLTGELIEYFLSNCPLLERLCVCCSQQLVNLKVIGATATFRLKYLEIFQCRKLKCLEISAPNLVSFKYFGPRINLQVENNPKLLEVTLGRGHVNNLVLLFSSYFTQIETLTIDINHTEEFTQSLKFTRLRHLKLKVQIHDNESLLGWRTLIRSCPLLHQFTLEVIMSAPFRQRKLKKVRGLHHENLKVVEVVGFGGYQTDMELLMYLVASSTALEKVIVNCRKPEYVGMPWRYKERVRAEQPGGRRRAQLLKRKLPSNVELVLIE